VHSTIEWRLKNGVPIATIHRFFLDGPEGDRAAKKQILKITKVGTVAAPGCPLAYVDASTHKNANVMARRAADKADVFNCRTDKAVIVGNTKGFEGLGIAGVNQ